MKNLIPVIILFSSQLFGNDSISNFEKVHSYCDSSLGKYVIYRKFIQNKHPLFLGVNQDSLETHIFHENELSKCKMLSQFELKKAVANTPLDFAQNFADQSDTTNQNAGITHFNQASQNYVLTVDLCPNKKKLDRTLFQSLIAPTLKLSKPVPIAISVTGNWLIKHKEDIDWLVELEKDNQLKITWINHTFTHPFSKELPIDSNFMLEPRVDAAYEVLRNERAMIESGITPSIFFRFPGLISDARTFSLVTSLGLLVVGADAWIAKNQKIKNGSILLLHANGSEELGITRFIKFLTTNKNLTIIDLKDALQKEVITKKL